MVFKHIKKWVDVIDLVFWVDVIDLVFWVDVIDLVFKCVETCTVKLSIDEKCLG